jgi:isocitrate dehydrogenase
MPKIKMTTPLVEMDGDEMTRVIWRMIKERLILPFVDLKSEYYDLGLPHRDETEDRVTEEAAHAIRKHGVGVKCATITPNAQRVEEYKLKRMWKSPNGTIRAILDGTVFRAPVVVKNVKPLVPRWEKPITIARHAYGDIYRCVEARVPKGGRAELVTTNADGAETRQEIMDYRESGGIALGMHNTDASIAGFARACFNYALETRQDLWFGAKDTISKVYDHRFKDVFNEVFGAEYRSRFASANLQYYYMLIDDAVARVMRSNGGFVWACRNYDGDVLSDMVATVFGSLAMMTSVLVSPEGHYEYEAAHGTVTRHYYNHLKGLETSTNSVATIFAWSGALKKRGQLDGLAELAAFAERLEKATVDTIEQGTMTKELALLSQDADNRAVDTEGFIMAVAERL